MLEILSMIKKYIVIGLGAVSGLVAVYFLGKSKEKAALELTQQKLNTQLVINDNEAIKHADAIQAEIPAAPAGTPAGDGPAAKRVQDDWGDGT